MKVFPIKQSKKIDPYFTPTQMERSIIKISQNPKLKNFLKEMRENEDKFQKVLLGCTIIANQVNNVWYILAGLNNKGMPLTQRTYDASTQLAGVPIQLGLITAIGITINKYSGKWAADLFNKLRSNPDRYRMARVGFRSFLTIFVSSLIPMRIVSPYFQAPFAKWIDHEYFTSYRENNIKKHSGSSIKPVK